MRLIRNAGSQWAHLVSFYLESFYHLLFQNEKIHLFYSFSARTQLFSYPKPIHKPTSISHLLMHLSNILRRTDISRFFMQKLLQNIYTFNFKHTWSIEKYRYSKYVHFYTKNLVKIFSTMENLEIWKWVWKWNKRAE